MTGFLSKLFGTEDAKTAAADAAKVQAAGYGQASDAFSQGAQEGSNLASQGIQEGANLGAQGIQEGANLGVQGLDSAQAFLQQREAMPLGIRNEALSGLSDYYQNREILGQEGLLDQALNSPLYQQMMESGKFGEEAILRNAAATGGLRSGGSQRDLYDYNTNLRNQALTTAYGDAANRQDRNRVLGMNELSGLTALDGYGPQIAQLLGQKGLMQGNARAAAGQLQGNARAAAGQLQGNARMAAGQSQSDAILGSSGAHSMGQQAVGQIHQQGRQNAMGTILGGIQGFANAGGIPGIKELFSDIRLKKNVKFIANVEGFNFYRWDWNEEAKELGLSGESVGVLAHEVFESFPEAVGEREGYITVSYDKLGVH